MFQLLGSKTALSRAQSHFSKTRLSALDTRLLSLAPAFSPTFLVTLSPGGVNKLCSVSSDQSSLLRAPGFEGEEDEEAGAATSVTETAVIEVTARTGRAVVFLSPLMKALIDFFQAGVGANREVLEVASWEEPTDSAVDPTAATS